MALAYHAQCVNCGTDAKLWCSLCKDAPEYQPGDPVGSAYCNRDCQKAHWSKHRASCRALGQRKKLLRTANILKAALLVYREVLYDIDLTKIEFKDGVLYLHQNRRPITARSKRGLFPGHLTTNINYKEAALAIHQCTTAMALLGRLTRNLLEGKTDRQDYHWDKREFTFCRGSLDYRTIGHPYWKATDSNKARPWSRLQQCATHTVLKVCRLFTNEAWVFDTAGCQYGFREVLVPFKTYLEDKSCQIVIEPTTYDTTETKDLDYFSTLPYLNKTRAQREDAKLERQARLHFAVFVDKYVSKDILNGSGAEFKGKLDNFVYELKLHMLNLGN